MKTTTLVAVGASITYGYPYKNKDSWVEHIRRESGWQVINAGIPGDTFEYIYNRLEEDVLYHRPDIVCLMAGTNDVNQGLSQPQIQGNILRVLERLYQDKIKVIIGLPTPVQSLREPSLQLLREWLRTYCREQGLVAIDFYQDFIDEAGQVREELLLDGCHPRRQGYALMGERAVKTLRDNAII
ncbi:MAG: GDSL-type esterase/lipase family protein [Desulfocucumaceae bacterium]